MSTLVVFLAIAAGPAAFISTDERITKLERQFRKTPRDSAVRDELVGAFLQKMRETSDGSYLAKASALVDGALNLDQPPYEARRRYVEIEMHRHHFAEAVTRSHVLLKEHPEDVIVWGLLGDASMELGQYDDAADAYQKMADLRPSLASYNRVAFYRFVTGDADGAIDMMRRGIRMGALRPENLAWCLTDLGNILFKTGGLSEAEQVYREALAAFVGYHPALAGLGRVMAARGQLQEAIKLLTQAQSKVPLPEYAGLLAKLYRKTGKERLAANQIAMLEIADKLDQAAGEPTNRTLALALADLDHRAPRALELARAELKVRQDVYTYDALAWALFKNSKIEEAAAAMERALSQNTHEPSFHIHAAAIYETLGHAETAQRHRDLSFAMAAP